MKTMMLILSILSLCACNVVKHKKSSAADSTVVKQNADIATSQETGKYISESDWGKLTYQYPLPVKGDTIINKVYPTAIIYEYGKNKTAAEMEKKDTASKITTESKEVHSDEVSKDKESKPVNLWMLLLIWGGWELVKMIVKFLKSKYSITIKQ